MGESVGGSVKDEDFFPKNIGLFPYDYFNVHIQNMFFERMVYSVNTTNNFLNWLFKGNQYPSPLTINEYDSYRRIPVIDAIRQKESIEITTRRYTRGDSKYSVSHSAEQNIPQGKYLIGLNGYLDYLDESCIKSSGKPLSYDISSLSKAIGWDVPFSYKENFTKDDYRGFYNTKIRMSSLSNDYFQTLLKMLFKLRYASFDAQIIHVPVNEITLSIDDVIGKTYRDIFLFLHHNAMSSWKENYNPSYEWLANKPDQTPTTGMDYSGQPIYSINKFIPNVYGVDKIYDTVYLNAYFPAVFDYLWNYKPNTKPRKIESVTFYANIFPVGLRLHHAYLQNHDYMDGWASKVSKAILVYQNYYENGNFSYDYSEVTLDAGNIISNCPVIPFNESDTLNSVENSGKADSIFYLSIDEETGAEIGVNLTPSGPTKLFPDRRLVKVYIDVTPLFEYVSKEHKQTEQ